MKRIASILCAGAAMALAHCGGGGSSNSGGPEVCIARPACLFDEVEYCTTGEDDCYYRFSDGSVVQCTDCQNCANGDAAANEACNTPG